MGSWLKMQQHSKASMTSDKRMMKTSVVEHGKQRWRIVNVTGTIERTFYQRFWFQRRRSGTVKSLIHKSRRHQSFDPRCTLPRASRGSERHVFFSYVLPVYFRQVLANAASLQFYEQMNKMKNLSVKFAKEDRVLSLFLNCKISNGFL